VKWQLSDAVSNICQALRDGTVTISPKASTHYKTKATLNSKTSNGSTSHDSKSSSSKGSGTVVSNRENANPKYAGMLDKLKTAMDGVGEEAAASGEEEMRGIDSDRPVVGPG
jgi:hypothetical protein